MRLHDNETISKYHASGHWGDATLLDTFDQNVASHPEQSAIVDPANRTSLVGSDARELTWYELGRAVDGLASALSSRGVGVDDVVVVQLPNVWELVALYLAVARTGGIISPLPMQWRQHEIRHVVDLTGAKVFIGASNFKGSDQIAMAGQATPGLTELVDLGELARLAGTAPDLVAPRVGGDDVFTLCWTSGTEAEPKGCPLTHNNWRFQSGLLVRLLGLPDSARLLCTAPVVNMTGVGVLLVPWLLTGGSLLLHHPLDMELLMQQMAEGADSTLLVPALLNMLVKQAEAGDLRLGPFGTIGTGSAPPSSHAMEEFRRRWGIEIVNIWGQNEGTAMVSGPTDVPEVSWRVNHFPWWGRSGITWPSSVTGIDIVLLDEEGRELTEPGQVGELAYRGPNVFPGYFRRPDLNISAFAPGGYFRSGDLFKILDGNYLGFYDRKKDIVIRGGFNISAAEVENLAIAHPGIADTAVVATPDEILGERVCIFVVPTDPLSPPSLDQITGFLREQNLATYKLPEQLELVEEIPRNPVGKILKGQLRNRLGLASP
ncbi:MAG: class I adenylate-forming enzyme family protein [Acidimicrobiales bacterium]